MSDEETRQKCQALTKAGKPCQNYAMEGADFCYPHRNEASRPAELCQALTADGASCRNPVEAGAAFCHVHRCQGETVDGEPCQNPAQPGTQYCHVHRCQAQTVDGDPCRNPAVSGGDYCHVHLELMESRQAADKKTDRQMEELVAELESLVSQLQSDVGSREPSPFSPRAMLNLVRQNVDRVTPDVVRDLRNSIEGASADDLVDPDTWKGMWYMLSYSAQFQAEQLRKRITGQSDEEDEG